MKHHRLPPSPPLIRSMNCGSLFIDVSAQCRPDRPSLFERRRVSAMDGLGKLTEREERIFLTGFVAGAEACADHDQIAVSQLDGYHITPER